MWIGVNLTGTGRIANRLADAVKVQVDMSLVSSTSAVGESIATDQHHIASERIPDAVPHHVAVQVTGERVRITAHGGNGNRSQRSYFSDRHKGAVFTALSTDSMQIDDQGLTVPTADSLSLARLVQIVQGLSPISRLYSTVIRRGVHAADDAMSSLDALQPIFHETELENELASLLADDVPVCHLRRVIASYTLSHLHMTKLDLVDSIERTDLVAALQADSRILVGRSGEGFVSTADIQEFFRDHGRIRGARWESFVWEESILVEGKSIYLMHDIAPDAIRVPEVIDAIRLVAKPQLSLADNRRVTDQHLGMLSNLAGPHQIGVGAIKSPIKSHLGSAGAEHAGSAAVEGFPRDVHVSQRSGLTAPGPESTPPLNGASDSRTHANPKVPNVRVGVLGYGVIGRRLADAVNVQPDMDLIGVAARSNSFSLRDAIWQGYDTYASTPVRINDFATKFPAIQGDFSELLTKVDVLLDCTPSGVPQQHRERLETRPDLVTIVQGGETSQTCEASFHSMTSFKQVAGKKRIRVISCSSTGTTRFLYALDRAFGVEQAFVTLARRSADPGKLSKVPTNSLVPTMGPSHHARDVESVFPGLRVSSVSVNCPTTLGHVLQFQVDLDVNPTRQQVIAALEQVPRVVVGRGIRSTAELSEHYVELGRRRGDRPEIYVFQESLSVCGSTVMAAISVHMESITIPETIDCIRAALQRTDDPWKSIAKTDHALGILQPNASYDGQSPTTESGGSHVRNAHCNS